MPLNWVLELVWDSLRNLVRHKLRSALTLLGVIFGVASVITMMAIGEGAQRSVLKEIEGLGLRNIIVESTKPPDVSSAAQSESSKNSRFLSYGITRKDVIQMRAALPGTAITSSHMVKEKVYYGRRRLDVETLGVFPDYFGFFDSRIVQGRGITDVDEDNANNVAVLTEQGAGSTAAVGGILGQNIRIGRRYFEVVGIMALTTRRGTGLVLIPRHTAEKTFGITTVKRESGRQEFTSTEVGQVIVRANDEEAVPAVAQLVQSTLERNHVNADYQVTVPLDILKSKQRTQRILNLVLITIASISLLVGGIGIMNIMLAIVVERIPEIGIRRAIGARRIDVFLQFLSETMTLSVLGGIVGCTLGFLMVPIASRWTGWTGIITPTAVLMSLAVSLAVGLVFGTAPAMRASRLHPVEALRYE